MIFFETLAVSFNLHAWFLQAGFRLRRAVLGRVPVRMTRCLAATIWNVRSVLNVESRADGAIRAEIGCAVLGLSKSQARDARFSEQLERLIDQRIYFGRDIRGQEAFPDLETIAADLAERVSNLKRAAPTRPVFISPFHYVSQYANIYIVERVAELLGLTSLSVVSGVPRNQFGDDQALIPGIQVLYTYGDANRNGLGVRVARALKRDGVAVLFADAPPFSMHRYPMETVSAFMFGKDARLHYGVFRIGATFDAIMLPFYLRFDQGRFDARFFDPIELAAPDAPQRLADDIQNALTDNYPQWLPAGHPAMYAFAPSR